MRLGISIDQDGCLGTNRPTTHNRPTLGVIHYCVTKYAGRSPARAVTAVGGHPAKRVRKLGWDYR